MRRLLLVAVLVLLLAGSFVAPAVMGGPAPATLVLKFPALRTFAGVEAKVLGVAPGLADSMPLRSSGTEMVAEPGFYAPGRFLSVLDGPVRLGTGQAGNLGARVPLGRAPAGVVDVADSAQALPWWDAVVDRVGPAGVGDWEQWPYADWENLTAGASPLWSLQGGGLSLRWPSGLDSVSGGEVGTPWYPVPQGGTLRVEAELHGGFVRSSRPNNGSTYYFFAPESFYLAVRFDTGAAEVWQSEGGPLVVARDVAVPSGAARYRVCVGCAGDSAITSVWVRHLACGPAGLPGFGLVEPSAWGYADSFDGPAASGSGPYPGWTEVSGYYPSWQWSRSGGSVTFQCSYADYSTTAAVGGPWAALSPGQSRIQVRAHFTGSVGSVVGVQFDVGGTVTWSPPVAGAERRICEGVPVPSGATKYRAYARVDRYASWYPYVRFNYLYLGPERAALAAVPEPPGLLVRTVGYPSGVDVTPDCFCKSGYRVQQYTGYLHVTVTQWGGEMYSVWRDLPSGCASLRVAGDAYLEPHGGDVRVEFDTGDFAALPFQSYKRSQVDEHVAVPPGARAYRLGFQYSRYSDFERPAWDLYSLSVSPEF
jgi:hypothetical protein